MGRSGVGRTATGRPNLLILLADDVGDSAISAFGSQIQTPNIDALARNGWILADFHTAPLCAPSRVE
ncbi:MAG TPA: sulfatase-like hydrolase/transferase [Nevskiaceae bacterium]|nr:sulfatase-like hydrolase/transferase [Nevskiaceae bacterium]